MRIALVNPTWSFENSIDVGCRSPHLPLELGACKVLLERAGHAVLMLDGALDGLSLEGLAERVADLAPTITVVTTAPTDLFWRCAQPGLREPRAVLDALAGRGGRTVAVGPHGSVTPETTLAKLACDIVVRGECEEVVTQLAEGGLDRPGSVPALAFRDGADTIVTGPPAATAFTDLPALSWPDAWVTRHVHRHHRFDRAPEGPGAEVEASCGCPYSCTFCAKIGLRDADRRRALPPILEEVDRLIALSRFRKSGGRFCVKNLRQTKNLSGRSVGLPTQVCLGVTFIDEIVLSRKPLLEALAAREVELVQTRIDLWNPDMRDKNHRASPDVRRLRGEPDGEAWERAHAHDLGPFDRFSDIQEERPAPLRELEAACCPA